MPTDYEFYKKRWKASGVRLDLSYGMFHKDVLVGFIINAIDKRKGIQTAYNAGTGVIPEYRGQRIVKTIYEYAIPELIKNGIAKCQLEVITKNAKAIKSYEDIGFKTCKYYKCFNGVISAESQYDFTLKKVSYKDISWNTLPNQRYYSWDNQSDSLVKLDYEYYQILSNNRVHSFFVINSKTGYLAQFDVLEDLPSNWNMLFVAIKSIAKDVRINNIDNRLTHKLKAVTSVGLKNSIDQYEMELFLK